MVRNKAVLAISLLLCLSAVLIAGASCEADGGLPDGATPLPTSHQVEICTERDCGPTLSVNLTGDIPEAYTFIVDGSGGRREVHCTNGAGEYGPGHFDSMSYLECRSFGVQFVNLSPAEMEITIRWGGGTFTQTLVPEYRVTYPNGADCPPKCRIGSATIELPAGE